MPKEAAPHRLRLTVQVASRSAADTRPTLPTPRTLRRWCQLVLERDLLITLRFVDTREGRALNRDHRGRDYATNVLTFNYADGATNDQADIVICLPVVKKEAAAAGITLRAHLAHMVIHGSLHAQGYDHETPRQAKRMEPREIAALARLRIANPYV